MTSAVRPRDDRTVRGLSLLVATTWLLAPGVAGAQRLVEVHAVPARVVLGETAQVQIQVSGAGSLTAVTNVGSVTPVRGGRATYTPPADRRPQVAVILVYGDGIAGAVSIPLLGRADLPVTTEPNATVVLEAGGDRFGPVVADDAGHAVIPIRLPPGIRSGTIVARDRVGNETRRPADLGTVDVPRALSARSGGALVAGEPTEITVAFAAAGPQGGLLAGTSVSSDDLEVVAERASAGVLVANVRARTKAGRLTVTGQFAGARANVTLNVAPGPPARIDVTSDPPHVPADGSTKPTVRAVVVDRHGNEADADPPEIAVEDATVEETDRDGRAAVATLGAQSLGSDGAIPPPARVHASGSGFEADFVLHWFDPEAIAVTVTLEPASVTAGATAPVKVHVVAKDGRGHPPDASQPLELQGDGITLPDRVVLSAGEASFEVPAPTKAGRRVLVARVGSSVGDATLEVAPEAPSRIQARFDPPRVAPGDFTDLHVEVLDRYGNRIESTPTVRADGIEIRRFRSVEGEAVGELRVPDGATRQRVVFRVEAAGLHARTRLDVGGATAFFAGAGVGLTHNLGALSTFPLALDVGWRPSMRGRPFSFAIEMRYASGSGQADVDGGERVDFSTRHLLVGGAASYRLSFGRFEPFAELAAGVAFTHSEVTPTIGAVDRRHHAEPSIELGAGLELLLGPGRVRLALRYGYLPLSAPLDGTATGFVILLGYRLDLF